MQWTVSGEVLHCWSTFVLCHSIIHVGCGPESIKDANTSEACQSETSSMLCKTTVQVSSLHQSSSQCQHGLKYNIKNVRETNWTLWQIALMIKMRPRSICGLLCFVMNYKWKLCCSWNKIVAVSNSAQMWIHQRLNKWKSNMNITYV